ncbi:hypothetical protein [Heyndrickxia ginsengihumi]|uniref:LysM domain-containing protein n=1 Tax=Heyndrickxia ginsengihumi TaxID=363870 RepID=A0A0A6XXL3_9BACI|nr:hypothetical protein [Heyndrickxia ginsengihumi]KHD84832.1 hypothetical protein NG54_12860 [Heyndrickxia ginsengihumi]MBE6183783.1 hypothetical protein [Bacillus sp. (in: firmicutes)]MCM3022756.1 hypothetical protein [Heyndrickxia ginsengihumi]NEY19674.1 hypothetical protein [Heyndrickxia ginsengihumi]
MKKFLAFISAIIILYSVYYDMRVGTIPAASYPSQQTIENNNQTTTSQQVATVQVDPGDTVISIVEKLSSTSNGTISIEKISKDFSKLNNGIKPTDIQIGQIYKFPIYN